MQALIWTAHDGKGAQYVAVENKPNDFEHWRRRDWAALPGLAGEASGQLGTGYIADAVKSGVLNKGDYWATKFGPIGFAADDGQPVFLDVDFSN